MSLPPLGRPRLSFEPRKLTTLDQVLDWCIYTTIVALCVLGLIF